MELNLQGRALRRIIMEDTLDHLAFPNVVFAEVDLLTGLSLPINQIPLELHSRIHHIQRPLVNLRINQHIYRVFLKAHLMGLHTHHDGLGFVGGEDEDLGGNAEWSGGLFLKGNGGLHAGVVKYYGELFVVV